MQVEPITIFYFLACVKCIPKEAPNNHNPTLALECSCVFEFLLIQKFSFFSQCQNAKIETCNLIDDLKLGYDFDNVTWFGHGTNYGSRSMVGSTSILNAPYSTFENITTPRNLDLEEEVVWELLKTTLNLNKKEWILQPWVVYALTFFGGQWW